MSARILLLCGGRSDEHEVSLASARSVLGAARGRFEVVPRVVSRDGRLLPEGPSRAVLGNGHAKPETAPERGTGLELDPRELTGFDVVFPVLHGPYGEDGTVQGLLELLGVPYVGSGVLGSAVGMDKLMMKRVFAAHGFPQVAHAGFARSAFRNDPEAALDTAEALGWPVFVKPANLGSSVGISRADDRAGLRAAFELAFGFDRRVVVEQGLVGAREVEVAVLGNDHPETSPVGEIRYRAAFYDYRAKYTEGEAELLIPAELAEPVAARCRELAREAFLAIDAAGLARVDFFVHGEQVLLNEINTMPGFTRTSMYPKLWEAAGVPYPELIARLVDLAREPR